HQDIPFEKLTEALQPDRSLSRSPFFQVLFTLQNAPAASAEFAALAVSPLQVDTGKERFDLTLTLGESAQSISGVLSYNSDLFEEVTSRRLVAHYLKLIESALAWPEQAVSSLPMLSQAELQQALVEWNDAAAPAPQAGVHELIRQQVELTPDAVAVEFDDEQVSYLELNRRANHLANYLRGRGLQAEALVGVCLERSPQMVEAVLAIMKAGAAYLPLDPDFPAARLRLILDDAQVDLLVTSARLRELTGERESLCGRLCLDTKWEEVA